MKNVKIVYTKETIMTNNNFTEGVTQKQSNGKMLKRYAVLHCDLRILQNSEAIILKSHIFLGALHKIYHIPSKYDPLGIPRDKKPLMLII